MNWAFELVVRLPVKDLVKNGIVSHKGVINLKIGGHALGQGKTVAEITSYIDRIGRTNKSTYLSVKADWPELKYLAHALYPSDSEELQ